MGIFETENVVVENDGVSTLNWSVPKNLFYFDGHFPHNPVLPAVAIIDLSVQLLQKAFPQKQLGNLLRVPSAKFSMLVAPESKITIQARLEKESDEWIVDWKDSATLDVAAQLRIVLTSV